ncbi:MAG TPA: BamA/TamA family outer membrane protein [Saprospiraceae bacterium]|nr:BamA/TamA family outer membrane protein [Saprospiraceae bacterium]HMQ83370.1 BamA/TamA family outer membrane protein [Saprospiraceae bacterium]
MGIKQAAKYTFGFISLLFLLSACNTTKFLGEDEYLLRGNAIKLKAKDNINRKRALKYDLSTLYQQTENSRFFFIPREWFYYTNQDAGDTTKFDRFQKRLIAEQPAVFDTAKADATVKAMQNYLDNKGYFNADVYWEDNIKKKKIYIDYYVTPGRVYTIDSLSFYSKDPAIQRILNNTSSETFLKKGLPLEAKTYEREKDRIFQHLRNQGYAYFYPYYIEPVEADTALGTNKARLMLEVSPPYEDSTHQQYYINEVEIYIDYTPGQLDSIQVDTVVNGVRLRTTNPAFKIKPEYIVRSIFLKKGNLFRQRDYDRTNNQLASLGTFRFVRIKQNTDTTGANLLNFRIELTHNKKMEFGFDFEVNYTNRNASGADNLIGFSLSPSLKNRNLLKGAELFITDLSAGIEINPTPRNVDRLWNTVDFRLQTDLYLPRFFDYLGIWKGLNKLRFQKRPLVIGDKFLNTLERHAATRFSASYNYLLILDFYSYNLLHATFGYDIPIANNRRLLINHVGIDYLNPNTAPLFESILEFNPFLARSFGEQLFTSVLFRDLQYVYNSRPDNRGRSHFLGINFELSGLEVWASNKLYNQWAGENDTFQLKLSQNKIIDFSQYLRAGLDLRHYWRFTPKNNLAVRLNMGIARPYGFTSDVPYVKQLFVGGPNSIRAWSPRGLGPGAFEDPLARSKNNNTRLYQTGDIQLEAALEYRFNIFWVVNGAFFLDAGNVWTVHPDVNRCGAQFLLKDKVYECLDADGNPSLYTNEAFFRQLAVGGGFGLRFDFSFFIFRLDMATKLRHPYPFVTDDSPSDWRDYWFRDFREQFGLSKVAFNLGFGYPF